MENNGKKNMTANFGRMVRCRGYVRNNRFIEVPTNELEIIDAVEYQKFDGTTALMRKSGPITDGYKFTIQGGKDKKPFTVILAISDIVQHHGHLIYLDAHDNPHKLPEGKTTSIKVMIDETGARREVIATINASLWTRTNKDGKTYEVIIPNNEFVMAQRLETFDGHCLGYAREKDLKQR